MNMLALQRWFAWFGWGVTARLDDIEQMLQTLVTKDEFMSAMTDLTAAVDEAVKTMSDAAAIIQTEIAALASAGQDTSALAALATQLHTASAALATENQAANPPAPVPAPGP